MEQFGTSYAITEDHTLGQTLLPIRVSRTLLDGGEEILVGSVIQNQPSPFTGILIRRTSIRNNGEVTHDGSYRRVAHALPRHLGLTQCQCQNLELRDMWNAGPDGFQAVYDQYHAPANEEHHVHGGPEAYGGAGIFFADENGVQNAVQNEAILLPLPELPPLDMLMAPPVHQVPIDWEALPGQPEWLPEPAHQQPIDWDALPGDNDIVMAVPAVEPPVDPPVDIDWDQLEAPEDPVVNLVPVEMQEPIVMEEDTQNPDQEENDEDGVARRLDFD